MLVTLELVMDLQIIRTNPSKGKFHSNKILNSSRGKFHNNKILNSSNRGQFHNSKILNSSRDKFHNNKIFNNIRNRDLIKVKTSKDIKDKDQEIKDNRKEIHSQEAHQALLQDLTALRHHSLDVFKM